jgi:hypothetical protein
MYEKCRVEVKTFIKGVMAAGKLAISKTVYQWTSHLRVYLPKSYLEAKKAQAEARTNNNKQGANTAICISGSLEEYLKAWLQSIR